MSLIHAVIRSKDIQHVDRNCNALLLMYVVCCIYIKLYKKQFMLGICTVYIVCTVYIYCAAMEPVPLTVHGRSFAPTITNLNVDFIILHMCVDIGHSGELSAKTRADLH